MMSDMNSMAFPVVEFTREGYKIRKIFGLKSTNIGTVLYEYIIWTYE